ncbi:MAG: sensor histidine kinase [Thermoleophilia bacterium]|nr:sensor histidine kinase [Thermoleophilia bacterium]
MRATLEYLQLVRRLQHLARSYRLDALIAVLAIQAIVVVAVSRDSPDAPQRTLWFCLPAIAVMVLPLFARRRFPFGAPAAYWLVAAGASFVDGRLIPFAGGVYILGMATAFLLGNLREAVRAWLGGAIVVGGAVIIIYNLPAHSAAEQLFIPLVFGISWLAGYALRERSQQAEAAEVRAAQAEREREAAARIAVAEERARIARELHDVVAHAVSVMVLQVGAVRHKLPQALEEDREALGHVEQAGRTALAEMRRLLGAIRPDGDEAELAPQPGLDGLDSLLDEVERAGLPARLHVEGEPFPLPRALDLSAYRIAQEGLTNALKHARATSADVVVRYRPEGIEVEVADDGSGPAASDGLGHGLVGIRERVKIYGGEMSAGAAPGGGFVLNARLPLDGRRAG